MGDLFTIQLFTEQQYSGINTFISYSLENDQFVIISLTKHKASSTAQISGQCLNLYFIVEIDLSTFNYD